MEYNLMCMLMCYDLSLMSDNVRSAIAVTTLIDRKTAGISARGAYTLSHPLELWVQLVASNFVFSPRSLNIQRGGGRASFLGEEVRGGG